MTQVEIIESSFKTLSHRTNNAFETIENVNKQQAQTYTGMNDVVDTIREMREKLRGLMSIQDDIANKCKGIDKIIMGGCEAGSYQAQDTHQVTRRKKEEDPKPDYSYKSKSTLDDLSDEEEPAASAKTEDKFDELSDEEEEPTAEAPDDIIESSPRADDESVGVDVEAEKAAALELAERLEKEFQEDEEALRIAEEEEGEESVKKEGDEAEEEALTEEEEARKIAEIELKRLQEEEDEIKRLEEEEEIKKLQQEEDDLRAEEEEIRKLEEEEAEAKSVEEDGTKCII